MRKPFNLLLAALACAALCLPARAQDETSDEGASREAMAPPAQTAKAGTPPPKPAKKTAARKKKPPVKKKKPASEYKFTADEPTPTYKFDKRADPIIKKAKGKKTAKQTAADAAAAARPKLQPVKTFAEQNAEADQAEGLPPGMKLPGTGGQ